MPKNKGEYLLEIFKLSSLTINIFIITGKGGKNYKKGKKFNEGEGNRRELIFKEDGQGRHQAS